MTYASKTEVPAEQSRAEIERTLTRYGATSFAYGWNKESASVAFEVSGRRIRFLLPMPARDDPAFTTYRRGDYSPPVNRTPGEAQKRWEQATRQRWRALALVVKAKLEAVEAGIATFEDEFLAYIALPDGSTVADHAHLAVAEAYETGRLPPLLALGGDTDH